MLLYWPLLSASLLIASLASFGWAMRNFFSRPDGYNRGMTLIKLLGVGFTLLHLLAMALTPGATAVQTFAAAVMYLAALGLFWWAIRTHGQRALSAAFSPDQPLHIVEDGPYRFIRHPFYCSYLLTWTAGFVATGQLWLLPTVAVMLGVYLRAARMEEEKFAQSPLAPGYRNYQSRTGLFLPNPLKWMNSRKKEADAVSLV